MAPVARPASFTVISRTRAPVTSRTPSRMASGHRIRSNDAFESLGQPEMHVPYRTHMFRLRCVRDAMAFGAGHQCQPSWFMPAATRLPSGEIGCGGSGGAAPGG